MSPRQTPPAGHAPALLHEPLSASARATHGSWPSSRDRPCPVDDNSYLYVPMSPRWQPLPSDWSSKRSVCASGAEARDSTTSLPLSLALKPIVERVITMSAVTAG